MSSPLKQNTATIQNLLNKINSLPEAGTDLPELTNEGFESDLLFGKELINSNGAKVVGTIPTKTASDLTASGAKVTVPAGYYPSDAEKSVSTASRANTTLSVAADDTADTLKIDASNNQSTGYVSGSNQTATTTVTLTASGATVTATETGGKKVSKSVATATQATPSISVNSSGLITASATQTAGYVSAGTKSATQQLTTQAAKTITPTKSSQTAVAKDVYTTGVVTVAAIPSEYIVTTDATASADEIMSGETAYINGNKVTGTMSNNGAISSTMDGITTKSVTIPKGYTSGGTVSLDNTIDNEVDIQEDLITQITAALEGKVAGGEQATPVISVNASGLITATAGDKSATKQLNTQASKTITPSTSSQTAVSSGVYTTGAITVAAIPSSYVKPTTTKGATTYTPGVSNQTISAGTYCSGVQTIKGDANLIASNIKSGVSIFGVTGTLTEGGGSGGSGGGNVATCTLTITSASGGIILGYTNNNLEFVCTTIPAGTSTYNIAKYTMVYIADGGGGSIMDVPSFKDHVLSTDGKYLIFGLSDNMTTTLTK